MTDRTPRIAILGCGPAGLFAAHAAHMGGASEVAIFSKPRKSYMRGAQYLHRPIPELSGGSFAVTYELWGSVEGYRDKVYGDMGDVLVSPETLVGVSDAWDIREAYDAAWNLYGETVRSADIGGDLHFFDWLVFNYDMVFSTVPAPLLCAKPGHHTFESQKVWATEGLKSFRDPAFQDDFGEDIDNVVVCSGDPQDWWYRQSRIHGWENTEFPQHRKPRVSEGHTVHEVVKPISTNCDCNRGITRLGRYGRWKKGVLSHESFYDVSRAIVAAEQGWVGA